MDSLTNGSSMQSQPDEITQNKDQDQSQTKKGRTFDEKADWDAETTKIWIDIDVGEVLAGNKPNTHFSKLGWRNLVAKFTKATGKKYDRSQHKNHWDTYKRKWQLWKYLVDGENDLGWDPVRQTVVASDEWWNAKIEKCPKVAMFKSKGLQHKDKLDILFSKPAATGSTPQADSSNALPIQMETSEKDDNSFSNDDQEDENLVPVDIDSQVAVNRAQKRICSENCLGRRKKRSCLARELSTSLKHIANAIENVAPKSMRLDPPGCSIHEIMQVVEETPGIVRGDDLYMFAARLFLKRQCRKMFEALKEPTIRLEWLKSMKASSNTLSFLHVFSS